MASRGIRCSCGILVVGAANGCNVGFDVLGQIAAISELGQRIGSALFREGIMSTLL